MSSLHNASLKLFSVSDHTGASWTRRVTSNRYSLGLPPWFSIWIPLSDLPPYDVLVRFRDVNLNVLVGPVFYNCEVLMTRGTGYHCIFRINPGTWPLLE